ncbi:MAG: hypothetical protein MRJ67_16125 [Nitrospirales bacterium]|nr:hypothetical protein [Nitrospirales bacterium]
MVDAIRFQAAGASTPRSARWGLSVPITGTYNVYARWAADAANATIASYTVHYAGSMTVVPMNQTQHSGQWNLLAPLPSTPRQTRWWNCPIKPMGGGSRCGDGRAQWREHRSCHLYPDVNE